MANENNFKETVNSLFKGMDSFISAKTVVGEAIHVGDTIILPLMDVSFGVGAGAFSGETKILDMVPDFVDRFTSGKGDEESVGESEK